MAGEDTFGRALGESINQLIRDTAWGIGLLWRWRQRRAALPQPQRNVHRACMGAALLTGGIYVTVNATTLIGERFPALAADFLRNPSNPPATLLVWTAGAVVGTAYLWLGLRGAVDGPNAGFAAFWSVAVPLGGSALLWLYAPAMFRDPWALGFYLMMLGYCAMRFWIAARGFGAARELVGEDIAENEFTWE
jgi:hypothetical protein